VSRGLGDAQVSFLSTPSITAEGDPYSMIDSFQEFFGGTRIASLRLAFHAVPMVIQSGVMVAEADILFS
jgi:hypothetical protein